MRTLRNEEKYISGDRLRLSPCTHLKSSSYNIIWFLGEEWGPEEA
jgi:hypothetical protein